MRMGVLMRDACSCVMRAHAPSRHVTRDGARLFFRIQRFCLFLKIRLILAHACMSGLMRLKGVGLTLGCWGLTLCCWGVLHLLAWRIRVLRRRWCVGAKSVRCGTPPHADTRRRQTSMCVHPNTLNPKP
jgi:hypothetical protein